MKKASDVQTLQEIRKDAKEAWLEQLQGDLPLICTGLSTCGISAKAKESRHLPGEWRWDKRQRGCPADRIWQLVF